MAGRQRQVIGVLVVTLGLLLGLAALRSSVTDSERIAADGGIVARAGLTTVVDAAPAVTDPSPSTTTTTTLPPSRPAALPAPTTTAQRRPVTTTAPPLTTTVPAPAATTSTTAATPVVAAAASTTTTTVPATTTTTVPATTTTTAPATTTTTTTTIDPCRNSADPTCGPFHFDPQPGADNPMTVAVTAEPASPVAGAPMVFHLTLTDPDGVSYDGTTFNFGNSGIGGSSPEPCTKYGPWDPPARDPASATQTMDVVHTYYEAGTYTATFFFDAGPFDCVDSVTGRGDRPYASSATGTVTVVVAPATS